MDISKKYKENISKKYFNTEEALFNISEYGSFLQQRLKAFNGENL